MNVKQQELIQTTLATLEIMPEVTAALFFERLFLVNPSFRSFFKNDMRIQGIKLIATLAWVAYYFSHSGKMLPAIRHLVARHVECGVTLGDFEAVREALLWTLEQALGKDFTPAVREAWMTCYDGLAAEMKAGGA